MFSHKYQCKFGREPWSLMVLPPQVQNQSLGRQLQDVQEKLSAEKEESRKAKRGAGILEQELQQARDQLQSVVLSYEQEKRKSSKYEVNHS